MRGGRRMRDGGLHVAEVGGDRDEPRRVDDPPGRLAAALHVERDHRAAGALLALRQRVLRMGRQAGVVDALDMLGCVSSQRASSSARGRLREHAQLERLQALQDHPGVERRQRRPGGAQEAVIGSPTSAFDPATAPPSTRPCPSRYLVAEWMTRSAPSSSGRCSAGVQNTLSTTSSAPACFAISARASMSETSVSGLDGVSRNSSRVLRPQRRRHSSTRVGETKVVSMPKRDRMVVEQLHGGAEHRVRAHDVVAALSVHHRGGEDRRHARGRARRRPRRPRAPPAGPGTSRPWGW